MRALEEAEMIRSHRDLMFCDTHKLRKDRTDVEISSGVRFGSLCVV